MPRPAADDAVGRAALARIYIYDTGSSDGTQDIARSYGTTVQQGYWDDDFARARNEAISMCESKWVLIIDADEAVQADPAVVKAKLLSAPAGVDWFTVQHISSPEPTRAVQMPSPRILNRRRVGYVGKVHEQVKNLSGDIATAKDLPAPALLMTHTGYEPELVQRKLARNLALAETAVAEYRAAADQAGLRRSLLDRARTRLGTGDVPGALQDYAELAEFPINDRVTAWGLEQYADILLEQGEADQAEALLPRLAPSGSAPERIIFLQARIALAQGRPQDALDLVRQVDRLTDAGAMVKDSSPILRLRMLAEANCENLDEALACCLTLMVSHREAEGLGRLLLILWAGRPADVLAQILSDAPADFIPQIVQELAAQDGIGPEVAQSLLSRVAPVASPAPATT